MDTHNWKAIKQQVEMRLQSKPQKLIRELSCEANENKPSQVFHQKSIFFVCAFRAAQEKVNCGWRLLKKADHESSSQ